MAAKIAGTKNTFTSYLNSALSARGTACIELLGLFNPIPRFTMTFGAQSAIESETLAVSSSTIPATILIDTSRSIDLQGAIIGGKLSVDGSQVANFIGTPTISISVPLGTHSVRLSVHNSLGFLSEAAQATVVVAQTNPPVQFSVTDLGTTPDHTFTCEPRAINNAGQVIGSCDIAPGGGTNPQGFVWDAARGITPLLGLAGSTITLPYGINDFGHIAGYSVVNGLSRGFYYDGDISHDIGLPPGATSLFPLAINNGDQIAAGADITAPGSPADPFIYEDGVFTPLGLPYPTGMVGINNSGSITGTTSTVNGFRGYVWKPTGVTSLPLGTFPRAINDAGQVVGESAFKAFLWVAGSGLVDLGALPTHSYSIAYSLNSVGHVVGSSSGAGGDRAFLWTQADGMVDLNAKLVNGSGWTLSYALGINNSGQIVGRGVHNGQHRAFLLLPQ